MIRFEQLPTEERALYLREAAVRLNIVDSRFKVFLRDWKL